MLLVPLAGQAQEVSNEVSTPPQGRKIQWDQPVMCFQNLKEIPVRVQCDDQLVDEEGELLISPDLSKVGVTCLVTPDQILGTDRSLRMTQSCFDYGGKERYQKLIDQGYQLLPAKPETPPGWMRDPRGRVFQVSFDLFNRFYLGANWTPTFAKEGDPDLSRSLYEVGIQTSSYDEYNRARHDTRILEGSIHLTGLESDFLLLSYDYNRRRKEPLIWVTSFIGKPRRHDVYFDLGWGFRLIDVESFSQADRTLVDVEWGEFHASWSIWQSPDLYESVRVELGGGLGALSGNDKQSQYVSQTAALKARFELGGNGLHYLTADMHWIMPYFTEGPNSGQLSYKSGGTLAYETVPLAIVDQPLSLRIAASGDYREDLTLGRGIWEANLVIGMRFSMWAPPRVSDGL